jgi:hypothetical protein
MTKTLLALFACSDAICQADGIYSLKYVDGDNNGFTLIDTAGASSLLSFETSEGSYGSFSSFFVAGSPVPESQFGTGGFEANGFVQVLSVHSSVHRPDVHAA